MSDDGDWEDLSGDELVLPDLSTELSSSAADSGADATAIIPDEDWLNAAKSPPVVQPVGASASATGSNDGGVYSSNNDASNGKPMILVDFTVLSEGTIHNRFDAHGVNDIDAKSTLAKKISSEYATYANDPALLASGTVKPCGSSVWPAALAALRQDNPGHFWAPVFPP